MVNSFPKDTAERAEFENRLVTGHDEGYVVAVFAGDGNSGLTKYLEDDEEDSDQDDALEERHDTEVLGSEYACILLISRTLRRRWRECLR